MSVNICSLNVRGLRDSIKRRKLFLWLRRKQFDIILLQETHSTKNDEILWGNEWGGKVIFTYFCANKTGCGCLMGNKFQFSIDQIIRDKEGRFLIIVINVDGETYTIANLYCPNKDDPTFFQNIY